MKYDTLQILGYLSGSNLTFMLTMSFSTTMSKSTFLNALKRQDFFPSASIKTVFSFMLHTLHLIYLLKADNMVLYRVRSKESPEQETAWADCVTRHDRAPQRVLHHQLVDLTKNTRRMYIIYNER